MSGKQHTTGTEQSHQSKKIEASRWKKERTIRRRHGIKLYMETGTRRKQTRGWGVFKSSDEDDNSRRVLMEQDTLQFLFEETHPARQRSKSKKKKRVGIAGNLWKACFPIRGEIPIPNQSRATYTQTRTPLWNRGVIWPTTRLVKNGSTKQDERARRRRKKKFEQNLKTYTLEEVEKVKANLAWNSRVCQLTN